MRIIRKSSELSISSYLPGTGCVPIEGRYHRYLIFGPKVNIWEYFIHVFITARYFMLSLSFLLYILILLTIELVVIDGIMSETKVLIVGGGIHGCSIAYELSKRNIPNTIIEATHIAAAASGKAGGFLARDWGSGPTRDMHRISYDMHKKLAEELNIESYRAIPTLSVHHRKGSNVASWLDKKSSSSLLDDNTAQVTPLELTQRLADEACKRGTEIVIGQAKRVEVKANKVVGVHVEGHGLLEASKVVICLGPWTGVFCEDNFGITMPMNGILSNAMIYKNIEAIKQEPYALFCDEDRNHCHLEVYPRPNGDVYICGLGHTDGSDHYISDDRLREGGDHATALDPKVNAERILAASKSFSSICTVAADRSPDISQVCMRPCPPDALPVMGKISHIDGAYVSAGHNCWGILWAPVCGQAMAELIVDGFCKVINLAPFNPMRFTRQ
jgi:glycine/D-amino acid oxidase-like deaminating enzyme